jgi:periplasmic protein TonB
MRELFRQVSDPRPAVGSRRFSALPVSIVVHAAVLVAVVVIPLLATDVLPEIQVGRVEYQLVDLPQLPSAPPALTPRVSTPLPAIDAAAAPTEAPTGIGRENLLATPALSNDDPLATSGVVITDVPPGLIAGVVVDTPPAPKPAAPVRAYSLLRPPVRLHDAAPVYPEVARAARVEGTVIIEAVISTTGDVVEARVLRSVPLLDQAAIDAVRHWKYTPSLLNGVPVPVVMTVTVTFTLR